MEDLSLPEQDVPADAPLSFQEPATEPLVAFQEPSQAERADTDPFGGSLRFEVDVPIGVAQLQEEIGSAVGGRVSLSLMPLRSGEPVGPQNAGVLFVHPGSFDPSCIQAVIDDHEVDPDFGLTDEQRAERQLLEKARTRQPLSAEEMTEVLALLAR